MKKSVDVLIITRSLVLQQGLGALLESLPGIRSVKSIKELSNAYVWIESHQPRIVLLDVALLGRDVHIVLEKFRSASPKTRRVLLVDYVDEMQGIPLYAEAILIKGESPSVVATIVNSLLPRKGDEPEQSDSNK